MRMTKMMMAVVAATLLAVEAGAREPNYDEAKVAPYTLEDPLAFADGRICGETPQEMLYSFAVNQ